MRDALASSRGNQDSSDKVVLLETLLADANKSKAKFEEESISSHQKVLKLEAEIKRVSSGASADVQVSGCSV